MPKYRSNEIKISTKTPPMIIFPFLTVGILLLPYAIIAFLVLYYGRNPVRSPCGNLASEFQLSVTVLLPTFNEEGYVAKKLENILSQTHPIKEILVFDCSVDSTPAIVSGYASKYPSVKMIRQNERVGNARTLNDAIGVATGDIIVKTDCDSLALSTNELEKLVSDFQDPKVGGVSGVCLSEKGIESYFRRFMTRLQIAESNIDSTVIGHSTSLLAFRKSATLKVRPDSMAEDTEELIAIRKNGFKTIVDPNVVSVEEVPARLGVRRVQKTRRAQGIIDAIATSDILFRRKYALFGTVVIPMEFFILVVSPFATIALVISAAVAFYIVSIYALLAFVLLLIILIGIRKDLFLSVFETQLESLVATVKILFHSRKQPRWKKVRP